MWSYDGTADILEIIFASGAASATAELAEGIFLRFDQQKEQPLSLGIVAATPLMQEQEYGLPLVELDGLSHLPEGERQRLLVMLQNPPVNHFLKLRSFRPETRVHAIPVMSLEPLPIAA